MAKQVINLQTVTINQREYRYIVLNQTEGYIDPLPMFLGCDLVAGAEFKHQVNNISRLHAKFAKRGLATKLAFPSGSAINGLNLASPEAWFYSVQGVIQIVFEHHSVDVQADTITVLQELWKQRLHEAELPNKMQLSAVNIPSTALSLNDALLFGRQIPAAAMDIMMLTPLSEILPDDPIEETVIESVVAGTSGCHASCPLDDLGADADESDEHEKLNQLFKDVIALCAGNKKKFKPDSNSSERKLLNCLTDFVHLLRLQLNGSGDILNGFLGLTTSIWCLYQDTTKLKEFECLEWGLGSKDNALLSLVAEWMGKKMNLFSGAISSKVLEYKQNHLAECFEDTIAPKDTISDVFPNFMELLVGYWIGLYKVVELEEGTATVDGCAARKGTKRKQKDHSYSSGVSSQDEGEEAGCSAQKKPVKSSAEHSYSTDPKLKEDVMSAGNLQREDHTYVCDCTANAEDCGSNREDHTYVSSRKGSNPGFGTVILTDTAKYPFVLLILEFMNNALVSGVAHVLNLRLLQSGNS